MSAIFLEKPASLRDLLIACRHQTARPRLSEEGLCDWKLPGVVDRQEIREPGLSKVLTKKKDLAGKPLFAGGRRLERLESGLADNIKELLPKGGLSCLVLPVQ